MRDMLATIEALEAAALQLPLVERGELIRRLLKTLDADQLDLTEEEWLALWADEAERRLQEVASGKMAELDGPTTLEAWRKLYP
jgi:hypothetical protein